MRILITGDLGFVGSATKQYIMRNHNSDSVFGFDIMRGAQDIIDSVMLESFVLKYEPDRILHLAAIARFSDADNNPLLAHDTNVIGTQNVVNIARKYSIPLVYTSTGSAIMPLDGYPAPYKESIPARGNSIYGCTKAMGEYIVASHTPHIILRYAHIYGREKRGHGLIGGFIQRIERGLQPNLYGGKQTNDFTYIKDIAMANYLALSASWDKWNNVYHIGTGEELSAKEAGEILCNLLGWKDGINVETGRTVDPGRFVFDITKAQVMLGYNPQYNFENGLKDMLSE